MCILSFVDHSHIIVQNPRDIFSSFVPKIPLFGFPAIWEAYVTMRRGFLGLQARARGVLARNLLRSWLRAKVKTADPWGLVDTPQHVAPP